MKHYVYRITNIKLNKHYYGTRTSKIKPKDDIGYIYFSSSHDEEFINDQRINPENYSYKVVYIFNTRQEAIELEIKLHNKFNVGVNESFYNKTKQTSVGFDTTGNRKVVEKMVKTRKENNSYKTGGVKQSKLKLSEKWKEEVGKQSSIKMYQTKIKNGTTPHGEKNGRALKINIYDENNNVIFECNGNFLSICKENDLPIYSFQQSYKNNTKISTKARGKIKKYINWYAKII